MDRKYEQTASELLKEKVRNRNPYHSIGGDDFCEDNLPYTEHTSAVKIVTDDTVKKVLKKLFIILNHDYIKFVGIGLIVAFLTWYFRLNKVR